MRLIDADKLIGLVNTLSSIPNCVWEASGILSAIEEQPTVEAEPVRHGHWIPSKKHKWLRRDDGSINDFAWSEYICNGPVCEICDDHICVHCDPDWRDSECVEHFECSECGEHSKHGEEKYCPECGVKMDG